MAHVLTPTSSTSKPARAPVFLGNIAERAGWVLASLTSFVLLWQALAMFANNEHRAPGPFTVFGTMRKLSAAGELWPHIFVTLQSMIAAFAIAMIVGSVIGILLGKHRKADLFFDPWVTIFLYQPAIVIITLCLIWGGFNQASIITAVALNKIPNTAVTMREGTRSLSRDLDEMAVIYKYGWWKTLRHVTIPQLAPYFATAARAGLALIWKIVLVVEAFGGKGRGVGYQIAAAFQDFDVATILAYAETFILIVLVIEAAFIQPMIAKANAWRR
jgi:NitT/TauT family transport system permease protein